MTGNKILLTGSLAYDHLLRYPKKFKDTLNKKSRINASFILDQKLVSLGGCAGNIAYGFNAIGFNDFDLVSVLGENDAKTYLDELSCSKEYITILKNSFSSCAYISTDSSMDQLTFFISNNAVDSNMSYLNFPANSEYSLALLSPHNINLMLEAFRFIKKMNIPMVFDPGQQISGFLAKDFLEILSYSKYFILNKQEFEYCLSLFAIKESDVLDMVEYLIVTDSENPVVIKSHRHNLNLSFEPKMSPKVVDPTGCGDAFRAGLFSSIVKGYDFEKAIEVSMHLAGRCLSSPITQGY